jgi:hypothetical protein
MTVISKPLCLPPRRNERRPSAHAHHSAKLSALAVGVAPTSLHHSLLFFTCGRRQRCSGRVLSAELGGTSGQPCLLAGTSLHGTSTTSRVRNGLCLWAPRVHGAPTPPERCHALLRKSTLGHRLLRPLLAGLASSKSALGCVRGNPWAGLSVESQ